jgi:hypothetical protein
LVGSARMELKMAVTGERNYDDLTQAKKDVFDAWWENSPYDVVDDVDHRVLDAAEEFLAACADHLRLNRCNPAAPTHADLLEEAGKWLPEVSVEGIVRQDEEAA